MRWVVGIDEAGYGPNLGPLVQAAVAVQLPDDDPAGWDTVRLHVRRCGEKDDGRPLVDDSKLVHAGPHGLRKLECGLATAVGLPAGPLADWLRVIVLPGVADALGGEGWYDGTEPIPLHVHPGPAGRLAAAGIVARVVGVKLVPTPAFNKMVDGSGSKATVLGTGLVGLLGAVGAGLPTGEAVAVHGDQLGGRRFYAPLLQEAFPAGWVIAEKESAGESRYRVMDVGREVVVTFRPRADAGSVAVALASMLCKYLREVCMRQFNRFWSGHVPGLKPTAGYPLDAKRFIAEIRPAMTRLGLAESAVWRAK